MIHLDKKGNLRYPFIRKSRIQNFNIISNIKRYFKGDLLHGYDY